MKPAEGNYVNYAAFMLETGVDADEQKELYEVFMEEMLQEKEKLYSFIEGKDYARLGKTVHNIKGISGSYKAYSLFVIAGKIDLDLKRGCYEDIGRSLDELFIAIDNVVTDIKMNFGL